MRITFLGTGSGAPSRTRNVAAIAVQLPEAARLWLLDCGEGTQHQILRSPLRPSQLERVLITHLHGDHVFGLPGLLASRSLQGGGVTPVNVHGPLGLGDWLLHTFEVSQTNLAYPLHVEAIAEGRIYEDERMAVDCRRMAHRTVAYGYALVEKDLPGRFDAEAAAALGIPPGPLYGRLKAGETVALPDGRVVDGAGLVGPARAGRKVVYCGDTAYTEAAVSLASGADVLIHEATNVEADRALAERAGHCTAAGAAEVAQRAGARLLVLTHFSPRYESSDGSRMAEMLAEATAIFPNTILAEDFQTLDVARPDPQGAAATPKARGR